MECIHTYSLVHDDLPSMDNDDLRRGRPTCHKVFGDGIAILAGDALLTIAFEIVSRAKPTSRYNMSILLREIAVAAGSQKLIAGQVADLEAEGHKTDREQLRYIHENKTAAILTTSVRLGAMSANANPKQLAAITKFGRALGLAFQVIDDILDVTQTSEKLGKSAGKDVAAKKATYPAVIGLEKSRAEAKRLTKQAHDSLSIFGKKGRNASRARQLSARTRVLISDWGAQVCPAAVGGSRFADDNSESRQRKFAIARAADVRPGQRPRAPRKDSRQREIRIDLFGDIRSEAAFQFQHRGERDHGGVVGAERRLRAFEFQSFPLAGVGELLPQFLVATDAAADGDKIDIVLLPPQSSCAPEHRQSPAETTRRDHLHPVIPSGSEGSLTG